ncbi:MAG: carboxypeptidase regulatory-like domain-containing protein, partial [Acidobacteria bacterium]|nr:carboxypeptidase regulatory-like domain-containing protein [Acidobacteriota bacterium]
QPFFETALAGTGYCNNFANCTTAVVNKQFNNFASQAVWALWSALDTGGKMTGFNFPQTMLNTVGQASSGVAINASVGYGNYHAGFVSLKMNEWKGLTMQQNFTYSKALGTASLPQSTSSFTADDPYNLSEMYGVQTFDRKFVYNIFMVYQPSLFKSQSGVLGRALGGWSFAPIFTAGSGAPLACLDNTGASQAFGSADGVGYGDAENCLPASRSGISNSVHSGVAGGNDSFGNSVATGTAGSTAGTELNMFADPVKVWSQFRPPILGLDTRAGGVGPVRGLPYWNMDMSVRKNFKITERFNAQFQLVVTNVFNHVVFFDPTLDITNPSSWGVLSAQGNLPRQMEFGLRFGW